MYEELVRLLKDKAERFDYDGWVDTAVVMEQAANAIEELSRIEHDFRKYISDQVNKTSGVYACRYCKNREAFDEDYGCGCDHTDCDGANEWEYGTPRKENE